MDGLGLSIASLSTELATNKTMTEVSLSVLKQEMENEEAVGNQMIQMMERSVNPSLGANVDVRL